MNLKEGTRRLALLLGVVGVIFGGFVGYMQLQSVLGQRARHVKFEQLANSDVVRQESKDVRSHPGWLVSAYPPDPSCNDNCSVIQKSGIKMIHWTPNYGVESIETEDGQTLYPTPAPGWWAYVLIAILPVLGFFIPWGAVRAIGWVVTGFVQGPK